MDSCEGIAGQQAVLEAAMGSLCPVAEAHELEVARDRMSVRASCAHSPTAPRGLEHVSAVGRGQGRQAGEEEGAECHAEGRVGV